MFFILTTSDMAKLCLVLSSVYDTRLPSFFNDEVQEDLSIIKKTLSDSTVIDICIPVNARLQSSISRIRRILGFLEFQAFNECHIVLNTHGSPGYSDLKQTCVVYMVTYLAQMNVKISQISALQCDGMTESLISRHPGLSLYATAEPKHHKKREADLVRLKKKLSALILDTEQNFKILGLDYPYTPSESTDTIQSVLLGTGGQALEVDIHARIFSKDYFEQILWNISKMKAHETLSKTEYRDIVNFFAFLLNYMKQHVIFAMHSHKPIDKNSEFYPLLDAVLKHHFLTAAHVHTLNHHQIDVAYKNWLKAHKCYSSERLAIFESFAALSLKNYQTLKKP